MTFFTIEMRYSGHVNHKQVNSDRLFNGIPLHFHYMTMILSFSVFLVKNSETEKVEQGIIQRNTHIFQENFVLRFKIV